ncbi:MAG: hypothetical protein DDT42_01070 [candidate division WS2 bacterium]|uniref:Type II toxin-antitoxin system HicB family antitoxin n=1 Tax=Psychracetigena formicireducens TaxID=2986056 RepID=A0A9E2F6B6_PSYF1|nr:hypothetical protein [Candidatus Psychracetigena formicireducens]MBT9145200.1 hypothetical protein [Candidatus Psychracetigena formicireducens]
MSRRPQIKLTDVVSIAFETNGRGYMGFIVELPGAFIRGVTEQEAVAKVKKEVRLWVKWLGYEQKHDYKIQIVQRHRSSLPIEDADNEILIEADKETIGEKEFRSLYDLVWYSGETFLQLYINSKFKEWVDESRIRKTFYGDNPKTIREIFDHVKYCQCYYLSKMKITEEIEGDFMGIRKFCLEKLEDLYRRNNNSLKFGVANERWTLKKVLRRFIWHDRIHGKAMTRILEKQKQLRVIDEYDDPFHFMEATSYNMV